MAVLGDGSVQSHGRAAVADPITNFRFIVRFYPHQYGAGLGWRPSGVMGFTSVSGLAYNVNTVSIREGGYNATVHQIPTSVEFSSLQLDRGVLLGSKQNWDWMKTLLRVVQGRSRNRKALFRADVEISALSSPVRYSMTSNSNSAYASGKDDEGLAAYDDFASIRFRLYNAWPSSVVYSDLNAGDNALMVERMTLVHEGLDVSWAKESRDGSLSPASRFGTKSR